MSTVAIPGLTAGIRTVLPSIRTSTRSVFHLLHTPPYLPSAERAIHCVSTERACTQKYGPLHLAAHSWDPRQRSRGMQSFDVPYACLWCIVSMLGGVRLYLCVMACYVSPLSFVCHLMHCEFPQRSSVTASGHGEVQRWEESKRLQHRCESLLKKLKEKEKEQEASSKQTAMLKETVTRSVGCLGDDELPLVCVCVCVFVCVCARARVCVCVVMRTFQY